RLRQRAVAVDRVVEPPRPELRRRRELFPNVQPHAVLASLLRGVLGDTDHRGPDTAGLQTGGDAPNVSAPMARPLRSTSRPPYVRSPSATDSTVSSRAVDGGSSLGRAPN